MGTIIRLPEQESFGLDQLVNVRAGQVASMDLTDHHEIQISVFAFDTNEGVSEETYPGDVLYYALRGKCIITIEAQEHTLTAGQGIFVKADVPHEVSGSEPYQLIQVMIHPKDKCQNQGANLFEHLEYSRVVSLKDQVSYEKNQVVSLTMANYVAFGLTLFAFDTGTKIGPHTASGDALPFILDGETEVTIGETVHHVKAGEGIVMPAGISHAVKAVTPFKMLLIVVRPSSASDIVQ